MSDLVYPVLPGLKFETTRGYSLRTLKERSASNRSVAQALTAYPHRTWDLSYEFLRESPSRLLSEMKILVGFFFRHYGDVDTFLFDDYADNSATDALIGTGNGSQTAWLMRRRFTPGFYEPMRDLKAISQVRVNGVATTAYTIDLATGIITFTSAPPNGHQVTADFTYYWRVSFATKDISTREFAKNFFELGSVKLEHEPS